MFMCIICTLVRRMYYAILDPYRLGCSHFRVPTDFDDVASSLQRRFVAMIMQYVGRHGFASSLPLLESSVRLKTACDNFFINDFFIQENSARNPSHSLKLSKMTKKDQ